MKLLRVGQKGNEKPAALDKEGKIRDLSSHVKDLNSDHVNFETISKLQSVDLSSLPELSSSERVGSCLTKPGKFVAIGLNYSDHAAETLIILPPFCFTINGKIALHIWYIDFTFTSKEKSQSLFSHSRMLP